MRDTKIAGDNIESAKQARRAEIEKSRCLITSPRHKQKPYHRLRIREEGGKKREASGRKQKTLRPAGRLREINEEVYKAAQPLREHTFRAKEGCGSQRRGKKEQGREIDRLTLFSFLSYFYT